MREIKFRAWDKKQKLYRYLDLDDAMIAEFQEDGCLEFRGQFTGLKDENGKEIYEGDFVYLKDHTDKYIVEYASSLARFICKGVNSNTERSPVLITEIIGNPYENPELLKGE